MSARPVRAGNAYVELTTKDLLKQGLTAAEARIKRLGTSVAAVGRQMATVGAATTAMTGAMLAPVGAAVAKFASVGDQLNKMSIRTNVSTEVLSELGFAAEQSGASLEQVGNALFRMQRRVANAATESGPAVRALKELGLSASELTHLSPDQQLAVIADAMSRVSNASLAAQYGFEIFGDGAKGLLPLLKEGSAGMQALRAEAKALGVSMSTQDAQAAADFGDAMNRVKRAIDGVTMAVGSALAPTLTDALGAVSDWVAGTSAWLRENQQLVLEITKGIAVVGALGIAATALGAAIAAAGAIISGVATIFGAVAGAITLAGTAMTGFAAVAAAVASPLGVIVIAITAVTGAIVGAGIASWRASGEMSEAWSRVGEAFGAVWGIAQEVFGGITEALSGGDWALAAQIATEGIKAAFLTIFAEIELAFLKLFARTVRIFGNIAAKVMQVATQGPVALMRGLDPGAVSALDAMEQTMIGEAESGAGSRRGQAAAARERLAALRPGREVRDSGPGTMEALPAGTAQAQRDQDTMRVDAESRRAMLASQRALETASGSIQRATAESERYRRASPQERIAIDRERAIAAASTDLQRATGDLARAQLAMQRARAAGDTQEAEKQRDLATRASESIDRAAIAGAEANSRYIEQMSEAMKQTIDVSMSTIGGFGGAGLQNLPQQFSGQTAEAEKQTQVQRMQLAMLRTIERHLRDNEGIAFS